MKSRRRTGRTPARGRSARVGRAALSRDRILEAAMRLVDQHGLEALTMRRLGSELEVEAMALYYYVPDKDALLEGLLQRLATGIAVQSPDAGDWTDALRAVYGAFRDRLKAHPNLLPVFTGKPVLTIDLLRLAEAQYSTLRRAGFSPEVTLDAYRALGPYLLGYVVTETQFTLSGRRASEYVPLISQLTPEEFPATVELMPYQARVNWDQQFNIGLELIFDGLKARLADAGQAGSEQP